MVQEVKKKLQEAKKQYKLYKPQAYEYRRTFLGNLAQDYADRDEHGKDAAHHL